MTNRSRYSGTAVISRNPSLTEQVKAHLKERILDGDFDQGRIPAENELASDLGVSRTTVRDALARLEQEGAIYRRQGAGTFVNEPGLQIKSRLEEIWSYEDVLRDHGYTPSIKLISSTEEPATEQAAEALGIDSDAPLFVMQKLFLEDDVPVVLTSNRVPVRLLREGAQPGGDEPIYRYLADNSDFTLSYYLSEIVPVALESEHADLLEVDPGTPAICFEETGFDQDNRPVVNATSYFRDDLLRFRLIRRGTGA